MKVEMKVKVTLTASEWELYSSVTGAGAVARKLNTAASKAINAAHKVYVTTNDKEAALMAAWDAWEPVSRSFSKFGANDSEPRRHFDYLLTKLFCKPHGISYDIY